MRKISNVTQLETAENSTGTVEVGNYTTEELVALYGEDKGLEKEVKDRVTKISNAIKDRLRNNAQSSDDKKVKCAGGGYVATMSIEDTSTINEERLIDWLKEKGLAKGIVKKREYVDNDALESAIFNNIISHEMVAEMSVCYDTGTREVLRIKKEKAK